MAASEDAVTLSDEMENARNVLCVHILSAMHFINGGDTAALDSIRVLAPSLVLFATLANKVVAFCTGLADIRDDVTRQHLVTHHVTSTEHDICPVLEDLLGTMFATIGSPDADTSIGRLTGCDGFELPPITTLGAFNVATIVRYAAPIQGVVDIDRLGNAPVCVDAVTSNVLKMLNTLSYVVQYSKSYATILANVEARCESLTAQRLGQSAYSQILFDNLPAELWVCMKLSANTLVTMAQLVQSSTQTWRREVVSIIYALYKFTPMPGSGDDENMQNEYLAALMEDMILKRYRAEKINNPTSDQKTPFMYLTLINMRIQRTMWQLYSGSTDIPEKVFPPEWSSISDVPPYTLEDIFNARRCGALILESSHHSRSCMVATTPEGFIMLDAATNKLVNAAQPSQLDACVLDMMHNMLWRAQFIHLTDNADDVSRCSERMIYRLLDEADLSVVRQSPSQLSNASET
jgi:hypothetical protein